MRYQSFLIAICVLFFSSICAQEKSISQEKWNAIVNNTNAKVTLAYISDLHNTSNQSPEDVDYFNNNLKPELEKSSFEHPIPFDALSTLMKDHFGITLREFSSKINDIKEGSRDIDFLFSSMDDALIKIKKRGLIDTTPIASLRAGITEYARKPETQVSIKEAETVPVINEENTIVKGKSILSLSNIIIAILSILLIFVFIRTGRKGREIEILKIKIHEIKNKLDSHIGLFGNSNKNKSRIRELNEEIASLKAIITQLKRQLSEATSTNNRKFNKVVVENEDNSDTSKDDSTTTSLTSNFFAGKPTPNRVFKEITQAEIPQGTIFKFTFSDSARTKASFKVINASEFMMRQITNSPDDFLYRVCNNVNSNQEFTREIVTERPGIAHLRDGVWVVDENEKALIKFK